MDAHRDYWAAVEAGDPDTIADATERLGMCRRYDPVATCPATLLHRLIEVVPADQREALIDEMVARRSEVFEQR